MPNPTARAGCDYWVTGPGAYEERGVLATIVAGLLRRLALACGAGLRRWRTKYGDNASAVNGLSLAHPPLSNAIVAVGYPARAP